jgi:acetyl-CoA carboxylase, biotin carboxylase subunit
MIAKLVTFAPTREENIRKMIRAIDEFEITGIETTLSFCKFVLQHEAFGSGNFNTKFVDKYFTPASLENKLEIEEEKIAAALGAYLLDQKKNSTSNPTISKSGNESKWKRNRM